MRTLLNVAIPPHYIDKQTISPPEPVPRTFSQNAVLDNLDDLVEVELDGTVIATPGAGTQEAKPALARGVTISGNPGKPGEATPAL